MVSRSFLRLLWAFCLTLGPVAAAAQLDSLPSSVNLGPVDPASPTGRMTLLLNRPPEQAAALESFLTAVQTTGSPEFHHWLTPVEFGRRFGPPESTIAAVSAWLQSQGLHVEMVSPSRQWIQFSGTIGGFNRAFSTRVDRFQVNGTTQAKQATPIRTPSALAGSIAAISPLINRMPSASISHSSKAQYHADTQHPLWTQPGSATPKYALAPADLAVQYNVTPLYTAGVNGTGKIIGIIGESNINAAAVDSFRSIFGLAKSPVQIIVDGADPGTLDNPTEFYRDLNDDPAVSYVGVETAGGLAPGAQIRLYVSAASEYQDPLLLAAQRAVDDNQADVLSLGYSECEEQLGNENALYAALWQQAAAQGQTVVVDAGFLGSAGCHGLSYGLQPNGMGSTPWNLSVGGTDFFYSDYATGGTSAASLWNSTNDPVTKASLKAPLPEQTWNDGIGLNAIPVIPYYTGPWAGGGAPSTCGIVSTPPGAALPQCVSGYPKPAWQSGKGVPNDGVRDTPDLSLFSGDGQNFSAYAICQFAQDCVPDASGNFSADLVGGTSAAAPAMAAIMALVDQKYGRQGQAAPVFYALAQTAPSVFHDVTRGGNQIACTVTPGFANCVPGPNGGGVSLGYPAGAGYDLATGLGSLDVAQLLQHWADVTAKGSTTSLQLSSASFPHGQSITASTRVTGSDGGTPTGDVALVTTSSLSAQQGQGDIVLQGGVGAEAIASLPGGTYQLTGRYGGDGIYGASTSAPTSVTITPESSVINFQTVLTGHYYGFGPFTPGTIAAYGEPIQLVVHPAGTSGNGVATGSATFTLNGSNYSASLNAGGYASWTPQALPVGQYTASATYAGDSSFAASTSTKLPFSVAQGIANISVDTSLTSTVLHQGDIGTVGITVGSQQLQAPGTLAPTGQVEVTLGDCNLYGNIYGTYQQVGTLTTPVGTSSTVSSALLHLANVPPGYYCLRAIYGGDTNWQAHGNLLLNTITVLSTPGVPTTTALQVTPTTIVASQTTSLIATVSAPAGLTTAPTGTVTFYDNGSDGNGSSLFYANLVPISATSSIAELTQISASQFFNSGINHMIAVYSGSNTYSPSSSTTVDLTATQPGGDFKLEASQNQVTLAAGKTSTVTLNLTSLLGFAGTVNLACQPSTTAATCSIAPGSIALTNTATATLSFNAFTAELVHQPDRREGIAVVVVCSLFLWPLRRRNWRRFALSVCGLVLLATAGGCGKGNFGGSAPSTPTNHPATAGSYTIAVNATSGGITHQVTILVTIQ